MVDIKIRKAGTADSERIIELLRQIGEHHHNGRPDMFRENLIKYNTDELKQILQTPERPVFVAVNENNIIGYAMCEIITFDNHKAYNNHKSFYIDDLCVDEKCRNGGTGSMLFEKCIEHAKEQGCYCIELNVWEFNQSAVKFYEKCGMVTRSRKMELIL